jgi:amino acid adenylation domain-containing protein
VNIKERIASLSVQDIRRLLKSQATASVSHSVGQLRVRSREGNVCLSFSQQRLWFIDQLEEGSAAYYISGAVRLRGVLDRAALCGALDTIVERHEALRTVFKNVDGSPVQEICNIGKFALQEIDLSGQAMEAQEAEVVRQAGEETRERFDLSVGPLIRGRLIRLSTDEHVLLMTAHHIVSDGWSMGVSIREMGILYTAYREGRTNPLPALRIQYADYAVWQREWLQGEVLQRQIDYWKTQLSGAPALLELPTDRPRPAVQSYCGGKIDFTLGVELSEQLRGLSKAHDVTLFMTLYGAFATLLSRLSGQEDIVIGAPVANRQRAEIEDLIGLFVNTLALRVQLSDNPSVSTLLARVKAMTLAAYGHQDVPFEQVVESVQPPRSLNHSPVFQILLALQNTPQAEVNLPGLTLTPQALPTGTSQFDLMLLLQESGGQIAGSFNYASDLFDNKTIERWLEHFKCVLTGMVQDVERRVGAIALLSESEQAVRRIANATDAERFDCFLHAGFIENALSFPEQIALEYSGGQMTYGELLARSCGLAKELISRGARPNQLIAVVLERGWEQVVAVLGILLSGAAYLPIDPRWPAQRRAHLLEQGEARIVVTQKALEEEFEWPVDVARICVSTEDAFERAHKIPVVSQSINDLAYVIFTSGSTGMPKGVVIDHKGAVNTVLHINRLFGVTKHDKVLAVSELNFDLSVYDIFGVLAAGGTVVIPDLALARDPDHWRAMIKQYRVSIWNSVPQLMSMLVDVAEFDGTEGISPLRLVLMSGDWIPVRLPDRIKALSPKTAVIGMGGATEGSVWSIYYPIEAVDRSWESIPYGKALPNQHMYVLNKQLQPCPDRVTGDIYIGGIGVALGYWKNEVLTQAQFMRHPESGESLYKTGDLGRFKSDGNIEFLGRTDQQVKIRGFRIELGEIEAQLGRHPSVDEAVVIVREDTPGERRLVAYFTVRDNDAPNIDDLRTHLKATLPDYMMPGAFVALEVLPLTPNGKLDKKALRQPESSAFPVQQYEAPQGKTEEILAVIWQELLALECVGRHDNFFELGGHSLLIMQIVERLRRAGLVADVRGLFSSASLAEMATVISTHSDLLQVPANLIPNHHGVKLDTSAMEVQI